MAQQPMRERRLSFNKVKGFFTGVKKSVSNTLVNIFKSPLSWKSVFWDSYIADEFPDHLMRITKILTGIGFILRFINTTFLGIFLTIDSVYSIYRHRFELKITKSWYEDMPRFARLLFGIMLVVQLVPIL